MVGVCVGAVSSDTAGSPVWGLGPPKLANRPPRFLRTLPFSSAVRTASSSETSQISSKAGFESVTGSVAPAASSSGSWQLSGYSSFWIAPT